MQVHQLLKIAAAALEEAGIEEARLEAELLLQGCLGVSRSRLFLLRDQQVDVQQEQQFRYCLARRCGREPLQYIQGSCEFWSLEFQVTPAVLIPRPETEFLLEHALSTLAHAQPRCPPRNILDLCTGSGVIAVVLAREFAGSAVTAVDCSWQALQVARENIICHDLAERIDLVCADLLTSFRPGVCFDCIVSNPPYVLRGDLAGLEPEVRDWEPVLALSGGKTGLECINRICRNAAQHLRPGGWLFMEIGADMEEPVADAFTSSGCYDQVRIIRDWAGRPRVLQAECRG